MGSSPIFCSGWPGVPDPLSNETVRCIGTSRSKRFFFFLKGQWWMSYWVKGDTLLRVKGDRCCGNTQLPKQEKDSFAGWNTLQKEKKMKTRVYFWGWFQNKKCIGHHFGTCNKRTLFVCLFLFLFFFSMLSCSLWLIFFSKLASGRNPPNPAIWLVPRAAGFLRSCR